MTDNDSNFPDLLPDILSNLSEGKGPTPVVPMRPPDSPRADTSTGTTADDYRDVYGSNRAAANRVPASSGEATPPAPSSSDLGMQQVPQALADIINRTVPPSKDVASQQQGTQQAAIQQAIGNAPPRPVPNILRLFNPNIGVPKEARQIPGYQPPSKLDNFEQFLGQFLTAMSSGLAGEGRGPGAAMRGAGIAMQAPYQQAVQQYQLGLQGRQVESQEQLRAAQEEFNRQRAREFEMVTVPQIGQDGKPMQDENGNPRMIQLPAKEAGQYLSRIGAATITGEAGKEKARIAAEAKLDAVAMQQKVMAGTATKWVPDVDAQSGQRFYRVYNKFGQQIGRADVNEISQFMSKTSSTVDFKQSQDGSWVAFPKTTATGPMLPIRGNNTGREGVSSMGTPKDSSGRQFWATSGNGRGNGPRGLRAVPVLDAQGNPVFGKVSANIDTMARTADATLDHIPILLNELDDMEQMGILGQFKGKWTDMVTSKGFQPLPGMSDADIQKVGKFINDVKLMDSAMLRTHFGARGGQQMYEKFHEMLNAGEHPELIRGALDSFSDYLNGYREMLTKPFGKGISTPSGGGKNTGGGTNKPSGNVNKDGFAIIGK